MRRHPVEPKTDPYAGQFHSPLGQNASDWAPPGTHLPSESAVANLLGIALPSSQGVESDALEGTYSDARISGKVE